MTAPDAEIIASAADPAESVNGFGAVAPEGPAAERPELFVLEASEEELAAHQERLETIHEKSGHCLWKNL